MPAAKKTAKRLGASNRSKATFDLPADLLHELRVVSVELPPRAIGGSLSGLVEQALRKRLKGLRDKYNNGRPFKARGPVETRKGRPPRV
jgi:hypothetical protein